MFFAILFTCPSQATELNCEKIVEDNSLYLHCLNHIKSYPLPIHFYYPKNLDESKSIVINLHFHGFNLDGYDHFNKVYGDYGNYLVESKINGIFLVPESSGHCTSYNTSFSNEDDAVKILNEVIKLHSFKSKYMSFSGHSGAYKVLNRLFRINQLEKKINSKIIGVGLFDATYDDVNPMIDFALSKNLNDFVFFDSFVDGPKGTTTTISHELAKEYNNSTNFYIYPVPSTSETILDQHFKLLKRLGVKNYLMKLTIAND